MNYQEWIEWRNDTNSPEKESRIEAYVASFSDAASALKENGNEELGEKTAAYANAMQTFYLGDKDISEEELANAYVTIHEYLNNDLKEGNNLKAVMEAGNLGNDSRDLFMSISEVNNDLELDVDLKWYSDKNKEINPTAKENIDQLLSAHKPLDPNLEVPEGMEENININQLSEEMAEVHERDRERDRRNREAEELERSHGFEDISEDEIREAERQSAALIAKKEEQRKKELEEKERRLKEEAEKAKKAKEAAAEAKKKEEEEKEKEKEAKKKEMLEREERRREHTYEVSDDMVREKRENAYFKELFKDERAELDAKHAGWYRGTNSGAHDDLSDAYDAFMKSLNTKNKKYSKDVKSKCKMQLKTTAEAYIEAKKAQGRSRGENVDDPNWVPRSKMGRRRYRSAKAIVENLNKFETDYDRLVMFEDDITAKRWTGKGGSSDDHFDLSRSFKSLKNYLKYEDRNSDPALKQKLMDDLRRDAENYLKKIAGEHLNDPNWQPKTTMGKRRFAAAKAVIIRLNQMEGRSMRKGQQLSQVNEPAANLQENVTPQTNTVNTSSDGANQQPINNDDMRRDINALQRLEEEDFQIRRSNSLTPKSKRLENFKEEAEIERQRQELEEEGVQYDDPFQDMTIDTKGTSRWSHKNGLVLHDKKIVTTVSRDNMKAFAPTVDNKKQLENAFMDICAVTIASDNYAKAKISNDELEQSKEALRNNKDFMDKVKKMSKNELNEAIREPAATYQKISKEIKNEEYNKMLEGNKQRSLAAPADITAQQDIYMNTLAIQYAKIRDDYSPNAIENSMKIIKANEKFMTAFSQKDNNNLKAGIQDPNDALKSFLAREKEYKKEPRDIDIWKNKQAYQNRADNHIDALDRISAKSCVKAMDELKKISESGQPLTEKQQKKAKQWMSVLVADEYIRTDTTGATHRNFHKYKKDFFKNFVNAIAKSPEYEHAMPNNLDADYIKNFLACKNVKGPKLLTNAVKNNIVRNKSRLNQFTTDRNIQKNRTKNRNIENAQARM